MAPDHPAQENPWNGRFPGSRIFAAHALSSCPMAFRSTLAADSRGASCCLTTYRLDRIPIYPSQRGTFAPGDRSAVNPWVSTWEEHAKVAVLGSILVLFALSLFPFRLNRNGALGFCFDVFSSREAAQRPTSLENACDHSHGRAMTELCRVAQIRASFPPQ
jgi:hypothetical protein